MTKEFQIDEIIERIKFLREKEGLSQAKFAALIGSSQGNVGDWERGRSLPSITALIAIVKQFNVSADWILFGNEVNRKNDASILDKHPELYNLLEGLSEKDEQLLRDFLEFLRHRAIKEEGANYKVVHMKQLSVAENHTPYSDEHYIPLLGDSAAGKPILINEVLGGYLPISKKISGQRAFAVRARGDSMIKAGIRDGDVVVVKPQPVVDRGDIALFRINDETTIKYFSPQGRDAVALVPANNKYKPIIIDPRDNFSIIGKVVHVIKKEEAEKILRHFQEE
ncbi:MAG: XRE family transcriptional regulator [Desulfitobacteriaceae bacterium]|nr:XRE family transcriptional regulator [Desulfitobacteriaceae bacterium]